MQLTEWSVMINMTLVIVAHQNYQSYKRKGHTENNEQLSLSMFYRHNKTRGYADDSSSCFLKSEIQVEHMYTSTCPQSTVTKWL
jgi:hypothetical protein